MGRNVLLCFDFDRDLFRAKAIRAACADIGREAIGFLGSDLQKSDRARDNRAAKAKITELVKDTAVTIVLIGRDTITQDWLERELTTTVKLGHGLLGIHVWQMKNEEGKPDSKGKNPIDRIDLVVNGKTVRASDVYRTYDWVTNAGKKNLEQWVEEAEKIAWERRPLWKAEL